MPLNAKRLRFVAQYLKDCNATQAAKRVGYAKKTAYAQGCRLLKNAEVAAAIERGRDDAARKAGLDTLAIYQAIREGLEFDPASLFDKQGHLLPVHEMPLAARRNLRGVEVETVLGDDEGGFVTVAKVKWTPRTQHVDQAARATGLYRDKVEVEAGGDLLDLISGGKPA